MAFPVPITSLLTGASVRQLAYWRRRTAAAAPLLVPAAKESGRYLYSWADIVALRTIVYLREEKSLPKIRRAVEKLRNLDADDWEHLSNYRLVRTGGTIVVKIQAGGLYDLEAAPGTVLPDVLMEDVLGPFEAKGRDVPPLPNPRPNIAVDPHVLDGYPVVRGSRVPFDVVAGLAEDGYEAADIVELYPSVDADAIADARDFAEQVAEVAA